MGPPPVANLVLGFGAAWLVLSLWALRGRALEVVRGALISQNVTALSEEFGTLAAGFGGPAGQDLPDPWQAAAVLTGYLLFFVVVTFLVFRPRDVI